MNPIQIQIERLKRLKEKTNTLIKDFVEENKEFIIDLNTQDQLYEHGITGNNKPIVPKYTAFTKAVKAYKGQRIDHVTLKDTGAFHRSFDLVISEDKFEIVARDSKTTKLKYDYGDDILGLTEDNIDVLRKELKAYLFGLIKHS